MVSKRGGADVIIAQIDGNTAFLAHFRRGYPLNTPVLFFIMRHTFRWDNQHRLCNHPRRVVEKTSSKSNQIDELK
jgi:hypothetical protein